MIYNTMKKYIKKVLLRQPQLIISHSCLKNKTFENKVPSYKNKPSNQFFIFLFLYENSYAVNFLKTHSSIKGIILKIKLKKKQVLAYKFYKSQRNIKTLKINIETKLLCLG